MLLVVVAVAGPAELHQMTRPPDAFWAALTFLAYLQVATAILNLLPVPGLDGYGIIEPYLPDRTRQLGARIKPFGLILLFLAIFAIPPARAAFTAVTGGIVDSAGAPVNGAYQGFQLFQFWGGW